MIIKLINKIMYVIKRVRILKFAKLMGLFSLLVGLIPGLITLIPALLRMVSGGFYRSYVTELIVVGLAIPLISGIVGFVYGLIVTAIYNRLAEFGHGIELEIEKLPDGQNNN